MAKKAKQEEVLVKCLDCHFCSGEVNNFLTDCSSKEANPYNYKKGLWEKPCKYYKHKR